MSFEQDKRLPKKRKRPNSSTIEDAVNEVLTKGQSINKTALVLQISRAYLAKIVKRVKDSGELTYKHCPNIGNKRIFTTEQETKLSDYLKTASKMCHGLTRHKTKKMAYQYAVANRVCPEKWKDFEIASEDWLRGFMSRHRDLSIRKPENTSLSRATSFNKTNVSNFFEKLSSVYIKYKFPPHMIFNTDETGCSTVTNPPKVIAQRGSKQIGQVTSAERGTLVTTLFFINAAGGFLPPVFVFPRVNYKDVMLSNGPAGALGLANASGWMNEECILKALKHFVMHVKPSLNNPALILMDNHSSHVNLSVVEYARQNSTIIVTFPPHCSHKLQPLDVSVYGPFKTKYRIAMNDWMMSNPGKTITIYQVGQFVKEAYLTAFSPHNVTKGFNRTGIYPLNTNIFSDEDFLSSFVTDRPDPTETANWNEANSTNAQNQHDTQETVRATSTSPSILMTSSLPLPSTSGQQKSIQSLGDHILSLPSTSGEQIITPEQIRPFLKAAPRQKTRGTRKMTSAIITDTPEKDKIEEKESKQKKKLVKKMVTKKSVKVLTKHDSSDSSIITLHDESTDSNSEEEVLSQITKKRGQRKTKLNVTPKKDKEKCVVCSEYYSKSKEEWFQCKLCSGWAHESCGIKGALNYFCQNCF